MYPHHGATRGEGHHQDDRRTWRGKTHPFSNRSRSRALTTTEPAAPPAACNMRQARSSGRSPPWRSPRRPRQTSSGPPGSPAFCRSCRRAARKEAGRWQSPRKALMVSCAVDAGSRDPGRWRGMAGRYMSPRGESRAPPGHRQDRRAGGEGAGLGAWGINLVGWAKGEQVLVYHGGRAEVHPAPIPVGVAAGGSQDPGPATRAGEGIARPLPASVPKGLRGELWWPAGTQTCISPWDCSPSAPGAPSRRRPPSRGNGIGAGPAGSVPALDHPAPGRGLPAGQAPAHAPGGSALTGGWNSSFQASRVGANMPPDLPWSVFPGTALAVELRSIWPSLRGPG